MKKIKIIIAVVIMSFSIAANAQVEKKVKSLPVGGIKPVRT